MLILKGGLKKAIPDPSEVPQLLAVKLVISCCIEATFLKKKALFHKGKRVREKYNEDKAVCNGHMGCVRLSLWRD